MSRFQDFNCKISTSKSQDQDFKNSRIQGPCRAGLENPCTWHAVACVGRGARSAVFRVPCSPCSGHHLATVRETGARDRCTGQVCGWCARSMRQGVPLDVSFAVSFDVSFAVCPVQAFGRSRWTDTGLAIGLHSAVRRLEADTMFRVGRGSGGYWRSVDRSSAVLEGVRALGVVRSLPRKGWIFQRWFGLGFQICFRMPGFSN